eukprot:6455833-Prymnesium_polylepis.1
MSNTVTSASGRSRLQSRTKSASKPLSKGAFTEGVLGTTGARAPFWKCPAAAGVVGASMLARTVARSFAS